MINIPVSHLCPCPAPTNTLAILSLLPEILQKLLNSGTRQLCGMVDLDFFFRKIYKFGFLLTELKELIFVKLPS